MNIKLIKMLSWTMLFCVVATVAMMFTPSIPSVKAYAFSADPIPDPPRGEIVADEFKAIKDFRWIDTKPREIIKPTKGSGVEPAVKNPFKLIRVTPTDKIKNYLIQLVHEKTAEDYWLREGDSLTETVTYGDQMGVKEVGKVVRLDEYHENDKIIYELMIDYKGTNFTLKATTQSLQDIKIEKEASNKLYLDLNKSNMNRLLKHEGVKKSDTSFDLNHDYFMALRANGMDQLQMLDFEQDVSKGIQIANMGQSCHLRKFGLQEGDVLVSFGKTKIEGQKNMDQAMGKVQSAMGLWGLSGEKKASFAVRRDGKLVTYHFNILENKGEHVNKFKKNSNER